MDSAYMPDMRVSGIQHEVSEFLYNLLEQIVFTSQEDGQDRARGMELSRLYSNYFFFSERAYPGSRWPTVDEVSRLLKIDSEQEGWQIPVSFRSYGIIILYLHSSLMGLYYNYVYICGLSSRGLAAT